MFELAVEENKVDIFWNEIQEILQALKENPQLNELMNHPKISKEEKVSVLENVFKGRISDEITGFLEIIVTKERYKELNAIFTCFVDKVKEEKGIGVAYVTSAIALSEIQKSQIEEKLLKTTSYKQMEMHYGEDASLIGGMVIRIKDRVVDSSVKAKIEELKKQLYQIQI